MKPIRTSQKTLTRIGVIISLSGIVFGGVYLARPVPIVVETRASPSETPRKQATVLVRPKKYSDFPHGTKAHALECSQCHKFPSPNWKTVRPEKEAFPDITDYPKHESCVGCHKAQFFKGRPPVICSICHTNPDRATALDFRTRTRVSFSTNRRRPKRRRTLISPLRSRMTNISTSSAGKAIPRTNQSKVKKAVPCVTRHYSRKEIPKMSS